MDLKEILQIAEAIARGAGQIIMEGFGSQQDSIAKTSAIDLVTKYDALSEAYITGELAKHFPDHRLMGEEGTVTDGESPFIWYIDPIDGTVNFAHGFPVFAVSIALYEGDQPRLGIVFDPTRDELFYALSGRGSYLKQKEGEPQRLSVSGATDLGRSLLGTGFPYDRQTSEINNFQQTIAFLIKCRGLRRAGSAALDVCYVASGRLDGFWEYKLKIWDVAAAGLILTEAGGRLSNISDRQPLKPQLVLNLVASTPGIHEQMFEVLSLKS
jgi:myo-inositol-1(or 4)-monophosphatase